MNFEFYLYFFLINLHRIFRIDTRCILQITTIPTKTRTVCDRRKEANGSNPQIKQKMYIGLLYYYAFFCRSIKCHKSLLQPYEALQDCACNHSFTSLLKMLINCNLLRKGK